MKIILANGTEVQLAQATYDGHYVVNCPMIKCIILQLKIRYMNQRLIIMFGHQKHIRRAGAL